MGDRVDQQTLRNLRVLLAPSLERLEAQPAKVQAGSALDRVDARVGHPYLISHTVAGAYVRAYDHLASIHNVLFKAGVLHAWAGLTAARAALESAAVSFWLIADPDETVRCERAIWWHTQEYSDHKSMVLKLAKTLGEGHPTYQGLLKDARELEAKRDRAIAHAEQIGCRRTVVDKPLRWSGLFDTVDEQAGLGPFTSHILWKMLSAVAHGRMSVARQLMELEVVTVDDKTAIVKMNPSEQHLLVAVGMASDLLTRSHGIYNRDRLHFKEYLAR